MIPSGSHACKVAGLLKLAGFLFVAFSSACQAGEAEQNAGTNSFPALPDVFQGRQFANELDRDVFFLRAIHDRYASQWPALLEANINITEYIQSPAKLLRFVDELGIAMAGRNDPAATARLALTTSDTNFFTNTNAYHPEILRAAAQALIKIGPTGCKTLAMSFTEDHYRQDSASLEELASVIGGERPTDPELRKALAATGFDFSTTNGGSFPRCTTEIVSNLLRLPEGSLVVRRHLNDAEVFSDPGRFQAVVEGIAAAHAADLATNLAALEADVRTKLGTLTNSPGAYRDDLQELDADIRKAISVPAKTKSGVE